MQVLLSQIIMLTNTEGYIGSEAGFICTQAQQAVQEMHNKKENLDLSYNCSIKFHFNVAFWHFICISSFFFFSKTPNMHRIKTLQ